MARGFRFGNDGESSTLPNIPSKRHLNDSKVKLLHRICLGRQLKSIGALTAKERSTTDFTRLVALVLIGGSKQFKPLLSLYTVFILKRSSSKFGVKPRVILKIYNIRYLSLLRSREYKLRTFRGVTP